MTFLNRGRPVFSRVGRPSEPAPEPVTQATGLPVAAPAPTGVTDDLRAAPAETWRAVSQTLFRNDVAVGTLASEDLAEWVADACNTLAEMDEAQAEWLASGGGPAYRIDRTGEPT